MQGENFPQDPPVHLTDCVCSQISGSLVHSVSFPCCFCGLINWLLRREEYFQINRKMCQETTKMYRSLQGNLCYLEQLCQGFPF